MRRLFGAALVMALAATAPVVAGDEAGMEQEQQPRRDEVARTLSDTSRLLTAYDYVAFNLSGPVVALQGFCTRAVIKKDADQDDRVAREASGCPGGCEEVGCGQVEQVRNGVPGRIVRDVGRRAGPGRDGQGDREPASGGG